MAAAQQAATGAKICTISAIRTIGRYFCKRRRIREASTRMIRTNHRGASESRSAGTQRLGKTSDRRTIFPCRVEITLLPRGFCPSEDFITPYYITSLRFCAYKCSSGWRISNHFEICTKFEQSLPKMVTKPKSWSTTTGSGLPVGQSLVVQVSGGTLARKSSVAPPINTKSKFAGK
jgi:hypothetical protein